MNSRKGILSVVTPPEIDVMDSPEKRSKRTSISITFSEADLEGMSQPHDDTLVVTYRGQCLLTLHGNFRAPLDPCHRGDTINTTLEG